ncbi:hypothetical protein F3129_06275 [Bacillus velezensis]|uniref:hypothetical protein n=1 Tax=Bacillus velezensis TaxID=492670 RepID=UPI001244915C|nr:hypothetical protein [Bacillus velezensis]QEV91034.1 hypothetical protein F3129_06275 [Bacillus velezensis]
MKINELEQKINSLSEMQQLIDSNVKFNIGTMWVVLSFVITAIGAALFFLAKSWFKSTIDKKEREYLLKLDKIKDDIKLELEKKTPKLLSLTLVVPGIGDGRNALIIDVNRYEQLNSLDNSKPQVFLQPKSYLNNLEVNFISKLNSFVVINKSLYYQHVEVLVINGVINDNSGIYNLISEDEARAMINEHTKL